MSTLPFSGQIIGATVRAFAITTDALANDVGCSPATVREYFAGKRMDPETRTRLVRGVLQVAMCSPVFSARVASPAAHHGEVLEPVVLAWCDRWDEFVAAWRVYPRSSAAQTAATAAALRLATIDLAVRTAGLASLLGVTAPAALPRWATFAVRPKGKGRLLNELLRNARLTRDELVERLAPSPSESAVDQYLAGATESATTEATRPMREHLFRLAEALATDRIAEQPPLIATTLELHYAVNELATRVAALAGWPVAAEVAQVFIDAWKITDAVIERAGSLRAGAALAFWGDGARRVAPGTLDLAAPSTDWREAIAVATRGDWFGYLTCAARRAERGRSAPFDSSRTPGSATEWSDKAWLHLALREDEAAIAAFRRAVATAPCDPEHHLDLASAIAWAELDDGPGGNRQRLEAALLEARIARELRCDWEEAVIEEALILDALGDGEGMEAVLRTPLERKPSRDDDSMLRYHMAAAAFQRGAPEVALRQLKPVLRRRDHAEALALAARCHHALGNEGNARDFVLRAAALGLDVILPQADH